MTRWFWRLWPHAHYGPPYIILGVGSVLINAELQDVAVYERLEDGTVAWQVGVPPLCRRCGR